MYTRPSILLGAGRVYVYREARFAFRGSVAPWVVSPCVQLSRFIHSVRSSLHRIEYLIASEIHATCLHRSEHCIYAKQHPPHTIVRLRQLHVSCMQLEANNIAIS